MDGLGIIRGCESALLSQLRTIVIEKYRHRHQRQSYRTKKTSRWPYAHSLNHLSGVWSAAPFGSTDDRQTQRLPGEQRENSTRETPEDGVCSNRTRRKHQVRLNEVVQQVQEDGKDAKARGQTRECRCDPVDILSEARPREPKYSDPEAEASDHNWRKSPLWNRHVVVRGKLAVVARRNDDHEDGTKNLA